MNSKKPVEYSPSLFSNSVSRLPKAVNLLDNLGFYVLPLLFEMDMDKLKQCVHVRGQNVIIYRNKDDYESDMENFIPGNTYGYFQSFYEMLFKAKLGNMEVSRYETKAWFPSIKNSVVFYGKEIATFSPDEVLRLLLKEDRFVI